MAEPNDVFQWEIWYVDWPHDDGGSKDRTVLAISTNSENVSEGFVRFVKITGEDHPGVPCRLCLEPRDVDFKHTGLVKKSWIHFTDIKKIHGNQLRRRIGHVGVFTAVYANFLLSKIGRGPP